jgi:hypothetical protein
VRLLNYQPWALLRASGHNDGSEYDLSVMTGADISGEGAGGGVANGALLLRFATAAWAGDAGDLAAARTEIAETMGAAALTDTAAVVALFDAIDRVADATGIPLEDQKAAITADFRSTIGIDDFAAADEKGYST